MRRLPTITAVAFVGFSLLLSIVLASFEGGRASTSYGAADSQGFEFGFNHRLTLEHYQIIFRNTSITASINAIGMHGTACLVLHVAGWWILFVSRARPASLVRELFFLAQLPIFLNGVLGLLFAPGLACDVITLRADGETFTDGLPIIWVGQGVWIFVSATIFVLSYLSRRQVGASTMISPLLSALLLMAFIAPLQANQVRAGQLGYTKDDFSIALPAGWKEVPPEEIYELRQSACENASLLLHGIVHLHQLETAEKPLATQLVLVPIERSGQAPYYVMGRFVAPNKPRADLVVHARSSGICNDHTELLSS